MNCPRCAKANRPGAKFCSGCGGPLAPRCPACGTQNEPEAQFCDACGAALAGKAPDESVARKVVTIVFADLMGSTSLQERLDPESTRRLMDRYYQAVRAPIEAYGGTVVQLLGDGVMCAFGVPRVAEDDAIRAVRAAVGVQQSFREFVREHSELAGKVGLRVAVNTGEVVVSDDYAAGIGDPLNVAARLQQEAHDGEVLISESTQRLVGALVTLAPFGVLALKGRSESVTAYRVVSLERPAGAPATPFVGRDEELRRITAVYDAVVSARRARLAVILGSPGLGKSRLIGELARRLGDRATVLTAHCDAAGSGSFAPVAEALRIVLRLDDGSSVDAMRATIEAALPATEADRARIAAGIAALLAGTPAPPEETFFVVRRLLAARAAQQPVVLAIDDLQWAEPLLLDLTEHLVQWSTDVPLLVLVAARPELRDARSSLAAPGPLVRDVVTLAGLDAGAATRLAANVIGADELPAAVAGRVLATSEGNPLFVGELVRMLVHDGALKREGDRWITGVELASVEMPPTIQALLAGRIDRLRPEERTILERAAVVGRQFSRAALTDLLPRELCADLDARLEALRRSELIEPDAGWFLGEPALRFHHVLIRDAAYRRLLRGTRAELHDRFAAWLKSRAGDAVEHDETIGWHLEQAHHHLREVGPLDERGRELGEQASRYLAAAGRRALARDDLALAASLLGRAIDRLDRDDPARADLALDWCEALLAAGDVGPAAKAVAELGRFTGAEPPAPIPDAGRLRAWHTCFAGQLAVLTDPQLLRATADAVAAAAEELASANDAAGEAKAHSVHALALARLGKIGASEAALDRALAAARRGRDRRRANAVLAGAPLAALWGPSPVTRASGRCLDVVRVLRITQGAPAVEAAALCCQGVLEALRGRSDAARRMITSARRMVEELGITQRLLETDVFAGQIELLENNVPAAERCLRNAYEGLRAHGLAIDAAQAAALLGRALLAQDRAAEAEALSREGEALAGDDLKASIAWRGVRAEALARRGEHGAAVELASAAVEIAAATDALLDHADARLALAVALRAAGRGDAAAVEDARAVELWDAKGATLLAERARRGAGRDVALPTLRDHVPSTAPPSRRVRSNGVTASMARFDRAFAARDADALAAALADTIETVHHPTGVTYDRSAALTSWTEQLAASNASVRHEPLATLGDSLALARVSVSASGMERGRVDVGPYERESCALMELDDQGRHMRIDVFESDRLSDAIARLYERYAALLSDGRERARAAAIAATFAGLIGPPDLARYTAVTAPDVDFVDHRTLGFESGRGAAIVQGFFRSLFELASDIAVGIDDVLALEPDGVILRWRTSGTERASGGTYERRFIVFWIFDADGLLSRLELFDPGRDADALARFDELKALARAPSVSAREARSGFEGNTASALVAARFANAATRSQDVVERCWRERDWNALVALFSPSHIMEDRRSLMRLSSSGEEFLHNLRILFATAGSSWQTEILATRGEGLALLRVQFSGEVTAGGLFASEHLSLIELDDTGRRIALVVFDLEDPDAAYEELDARFAAGEGAPYAQLLGNQEAFRRAAPRGNLRTLNRLLPPDFTMTSHRRLASIGGRVGRADYLTNVGLVSDLGARGELRLNHLRLSATAAIGDSMWRGTRDSGAFEISMVFVYSHDGHCFHDWEMYDPEQIDEAVARYERLSAVTPSTAPIANAATRALRTMEEAFAGRDWERAAADFAPEFTMLDRRSIVRLDLDRDQHLQSLRAMFEMATTLTNHVLATRGDRLALARARWEGAARSVGPSEAVWLMVIEMNDRGKRVAIVNFDPDDVEAAYAELDARYAAGEAAAYERVSAAMQRFRRAFADRDWNTLRAQLAPDLVVDDHRLLGWEPLHGAAAYVDALRSMVELAPDVRFRLDHVEICARGYLVLTNWVGTREGGAFEAPSLIVGELDDSSRVRRFDQYDVEHLDEARRRFAAIDRATVRPAAHPTERPHDEYKG